MEETIVFPQPSIDDGAGKISDMGIAILTQITGGARGSGLLATYNFQALQKVSSFPEVRDVKLVDAQSRTFYATIKNP